MSQRILVIDNDVGILNMLIGVLSEFGYEVLTSNDGSYACRLVRDKQPDLIILDVILPGMGGLEVCQTLRKDGISVPIIFLSSMCHEVDRILGFEFGGDDYMTKPFSPNELLSRIKAILRRTYKRKNTEYLARVYQYGDLLIDANKYEVSIQEKHIELTLKEFDILHYLATNAGTAVSRTQILDHVWGKNSEGKSRVVDVFIAALREKIEVDSKNPRYLKTVRGLGYKFETNQ